MKETEEMYPSWSDDHGVRLGNVKISDLHDFKEHPFHVVEDSALFELARELWNSSFHEAKLLSVLIFDKKTISHLEK